MGLNGTRTPLKVGLALGSGVARGLAHIGVLKVLEREGIPIDMISGTSIGALVGALYAQGRSIEEISSLAREAGEKKYTFMTDITIPRTGLIRGKKIEKILESFYHDMKISELRIPFACVATDIDTGREVVIDHGNLTEAIRATVSLPVVLSLAEWENRHLVDGALVNPVPVDVLKGMGADFTIAVNVIPSRHAENSTTPNIFGVIMQTLYIVGYHALESSVENADVLIEPDVEKIGLTDFKKVDEGIKRGEEAADKALSEIRKLISAKEKALSAERSGSTS